MPVNQLCLEATGHARPLSFPGSPTAVQGMKAAMDQYHYLTIRWRLSGPRMPEMEMRWPDVSPPLQWTSQSSDQHLRAKISSWKSCHFIGMSVSCQSLGISSVIELLTRGKTAVIMTSVIRTNNGSCTGVSLSAGRCIQRNIDHP